MRSRGDARLLFVLSNDYGELSNALYFLAGQAFVSRTTLLLPPRIFESNRGTLPGQIREYRSVEDVIEAVDTSEQDIVFLFSGYLYTINSLFTVESLEVLVQFLRARARRVVTSDPFLGALARTATAEALGRIHPPFRRAFELLKQTIHFYPVPCDRVPAEIDRVSVFNPQFGRDEIGPSDRTRRLLRELGVDLDRRFWLFVLSSEDYETQLGKHGGQFVDQVIRMLTRATEEGRQAVFVGPPVCIDVLRPRMGAVPGVALQSFCSHQFFVRLILNSEYVFYWNMFSNSAILRLANGLPAFFFDIGHLDRTPGLCKLAVDNYYQGWQPICLDQRQELRMPVLVMVDTVCRGHFDRIRHYFRSSPSPEQALASILGERPTTTS